MSGQSQSFTHVQQKCSEVLECYLELCVLFFHACSSHGMYIFYLFAIQKGKGIGVVCVQMHEIIFLPQTYLKSCSNNYNNARICLSV